MRVGSALRPSEVIPALVVIAVEHFENIGRRGCFAPNLDGRFDYPRAPERTFRLPSSCGPYIAVGRKPLDCDLHTDLNCARARNVEILTGVVRRAGEPDE